MEKIGPHHSCLTSSVAGPVLHHGCARAVVDVPDVERVKPVALAAVLGVVLLAVIVQVGPQTMQRESSTPASASQHYISTPQTIDFGGTCEILQGCRVTLAKSP